MNAAEKRDNAIQRLRELASLDDIEASHIRADAVLLELIDDPEVAEAFENVPKWYA